VRHRVFMIRRTVTEKGEKRVEVVYGITNLPRKKANAQRLLELNRKHWYIENRLHLRRDVTDYAKMLPKSVLRALQ
jgi:predicted transposase YbfD/YdcC